MKRFLSAMTTLGLLTAAVTLSADEPASPTAAAKPAAAKLAPVPTSGGVAKLAPSNTRITFIGLHEGDEPKPRLGGFSKFAGQAEVDAAGELKGVTLDIDTRSLWTEIDRLTAHLKSPDFFAVREHPTAKFRSTSIAAADGAGKYTVNGDLTLLGVTRPIRLPVTVENGPRGVTLVSDFAFDRREFGMEYGQGQVKNDVTVKVRVGEPSQAKASAPDNASER